MTTLTIGPLQLAGLQCHSPLDDLPGSLDGRRLTFDDANAMAGYVTDAANSADAQVERDHDPADLCMCRALGDLARRIARAA